MGAVAGVPLRRAGPGAAVTIPARRKKGARSGQGALTHLPRTRRRSWLPSAGLLREEGYRAKRLERPPPARTPDPSNFHRHPPRATKRRPHTRELSHTCWLSLSANHEDGSLPASQSPGGRAASPPRRRRFNQSEAAQGVGRREATEGGKELGCGTGRAELPWGLEEWGGPSRRAGPGLRPWGGASVEPAPTCIESCLTCKIAFFIEQL